LKKKLFKYKTDTGFSSNIKNEGNRLLNKDGSVSLKRIGLSFSQRFSVFHWLINMNWISFFAFLLAGYILINIFFALIYVSIGINGLSGNHSEQFYFQFLDAFYFSSQTLTTVGFGAISPVDTAHNLIASFESFLGLLSFAMSTGLLYGRFSKPQAKTLFSKNALISPYKNDKKGLMVRIANSQDNQLINVNANLILSWIENESSNKKRKFQNLTLEYEHINMLVSSWTIVAPLDEDNMKFLQSAENIRSHKVELLLQINAYDETYSQQIHSRTSYTCDEIIWGSKFSSILGHDENGDAILRLDKFDEYIMIDL
jgi:inward rectifier potassium channel